MLDIQNIVHSRIKNKYPSALKTKYPNTFFTTDNRILDNPNFPTIYTHLLSTQERGNDLENLTINAVLATVQVEVYDNESQDSANEVMNYVVDTMKSMAFSIIQMPENMNTSSTYRMVARFRRMIGSSDTL